MARLGKSPQREKLNNRPARRITLCMITHIPHIAGYYKDRMNITELSLNSMISNASEDREFDVTILDQNSCPEWKQKLASWQGSGWIDNVIFLGSNVGKLEGLRILLNSVQSEVIGYADDDVLFFKDWLDKQMEVLDGVPPCFLVTGSPVLTKFKWYPKQLEWMKSMSEFEVTPGKLGKDYPIKWMRDDALCRGMQPDNYMKIVKQDEDDRPPFIEYDGIKAWAVGHHMQLLAKRRAILACLPRPSKKLMGQMREWDTAIDNGGILQLASFERTSRHMGNVMDQQIVNDAIEMGLVI